MKCLVGIGSAVIILFIFLFCPIKTTGEVEYLRIHIRANSNSVVDQNVKYKVKDEIVETLIPLLSEIESFDEAKQKMREHFDLIEESANRVLKEEGFSYKSTLQEGYYDALIVELGSGEGNNWWCIVFPAFCFTKTQNSDNYEYISLIWEIIKSVK